jgi:hypothetical protein
MNIKNKHSCTFATKVTAPRSFRNSDNHLKKEFQSSELQTSDKEEDSVHHKYEDDDLKKFTC